MWCMYTVKYQSATKRNEIGSFVEMWNKPKVYQVELGKSQTERNKYCILTHVCGIQKSDTDEHISRAGIEIQMWIMEMWIQR